MDVAHILIAGIILCLSSAAQSAVGFGYALYATPLLVWLGLPLPSALVLVGTCSLFQSSTGAYKLRQYVPWKLVLKGCAIRGVTTLAGMALMFQLIELDRSSMQLWLGIILCSILAMQLLLRPKPQPKIAAGWTWASYSLSGLLSGISGMGGPPIVIWAMAHDWETKRIRGLLFATFAICIPFQLVLLAATLGSQVLHDVLIGLCFLPLVYLGQKIGHPIGNRISRPRLSQLAYLILFVIGVGSIWPSL